MPAADADCPTKQLTNGKRSTMELSCRLGKYVPAIAGSLEASIRDRTNLALIDLALAENRVCQSEILEIYKAALESSLEKDASIMSRTINRALRTDRPIQALVVSHRAWRPAILNRCLCCLLQWSFQTVPANLARACRRRSRRYCMLDGAFD
jgi:hypothetical protein